jgi:cytochrome c oxidase subunit II
MVSIPKRLGLQLATAVMLIAQVHTVAADWTLNLTQGVTPVSRDLYNLHMLIFWICVAIGIGVFSVMFYSIYRHRKSQGAVAAQFHESAVVEVAWTVLPFLILVGMAVPATRALIAMENTDNPDLTIQITGYQWKWKYEYLKEGLKFFSVLDQKSNEARQLNSGVDPATVDHYLLNVDRPLVIPVNKKVRFLVTSADVIHSWWVPDFGVKRDAIPGFINEAWTRVEQPGTYRGQCAELCGKDHGFMPIVVVAKEQADYQSWLADMAKVDSNAWKCAAAVCSKDELIAKGEEIYNTNCAACHQANGQGIPGAVPGLVAGSAFEGGADMTKPLVDYGFWKDGKVVLGPVENHIAIVLKGIADTAMGAFGEQLSNDSEVAALVTYERNTWGNNSGEVVQPSQIAAAR